MNPNRGFDSDAREAGARQAGHMRAIQTIIATALLCGCASSHNLATDGNNLLGGGYFQSKVHDGIF